MRGPPKKVITLNNQPGIAFELIKTDGTRACFLDSTLFPDAFERFERDYGLRIVDLKLAAKNRQIIFVPGDEGGNRGGGYFNVWQTRTYAEEKALGLLDEYEEDNLDPDKWLN